MGLRAGYFFWLGCWLRLWPNVPGAAWLCAGALFAAGTILAVRSGTTPWKWLREHWKEALFTEGVFLILFAGLTYIRAFDAGASHTERPMDLAFLNAILRSPYFPPNDPWLSGYAISYYHFGYILTAMLAKMTGLAGNVAFSLGFTGSFSMAGLGAYGLLRNLLLLKAKAVAQPIPDPESPAAPALPETKSNFWTSNHLWLPLLATFTLLFLGNMEGGLEILYAQHVGWEDGNGVFWRELDITGLNEPPMGEKSLIPNRAGWWWWAAARVIHDVDANGVTDPYGVIDEFPAFSFVIGDMHPHVMTLPFLLAAVAVVLETLLRGGGTGEESSIERWSFIALSALSVGSLLFLNTWDILFFGMAAIAGWVGWRMSRKELAFAGFSGWKAYFARWILTAVSAVARFIPFLIGFSSQAGGILPNVLNPTRGGQFFVMFGTLLVPVAVWLILELWKGSWKPDWKNGWLLAGAGLAVLLAGSLVLGFFLSMVPVSRIDPGDLTIGLIRRTDFWATLVPLSMIAAAAAVLLGLARKRSASDEPPVAESSAGGVRWVEAFLLILVFWGALLILFPEYLYLRDSFGTRMNTVFKFYFQAWAFLSLAAAYGVIRLIQVVRDETEIDSVRWAFSAVGSVLVVAVLLIGSIYYPLAVWTKTNEAKSSFEPTLDASAFLRSEHPDDAPAIAWIVANIRDNGPLVEAVGNDYDANAAKAATFTGIPGVLGWIGHEGQWRGGGSLYEPRINDIEQLYKTIDWFTAEEILDRYGIRYVYFGPLEAARYGTRGLDKFRAHMNVIYESKSVVIFERIAE
jgi:YYY domain-containing protein